MISGYPYIAVAVGSALGSLLRYVVSIASLSVFGSWFPLGTLSVNVLGSWLIAWLATAGSLQRHGRVVRWQSFLVAGFCGGFTTFSLFSLETLSLLTEGRQGAALLYVSVSLPLWLVAAWHGQRVALRGSVVKSAGRHGA